MEDGRRRRVLLLTPTGRDAALIADAFSRYGITAEACPDGNGLIGEVRKGAGAIIIAEEALTAALRAALADQPPWSDLPAVLLSTTGESTPELTSRLERLAPLGNVTVIERPLRPATLISIVRMALRARERQYEVERLMCDLELAEERLRTMIESAHDHAIVNLDLAGRVTYWNSGAERLLGYSDKAILGRSIDMIFEVEARTSGEPARELETALRTGHAETEGWRVRRDGSRFWGSGVVSPTRDPAGAVTGFVKVLRDMTDHKRAAEQLAAQTKALEQSNEDLQRFAYVASHDLQEPLRVVSSYTQLLVRKNEGRLDSDSQEFVKFIVDGVNRMRTLIQDLLDFSRVTSGPGRSLEPVDANAMLGLALQHLQVKIRDTGAKITSDRLPRVLAHDSRLMQVFQNLIGNAIKYSTGTPEIHISAELCGELWRIGVSDNGIGIEPEYHERIFGLFQRLHTRAEYPGTGLGLAISKRVIEQMGGRIWVESEPKAGSTFYFTLRAVEPEPEGISHLTGASRSLQ